MQSFVILGADPRSDDAAVRAAYLEKVKQHPPEKSSEAFALVSSAYAKVKDADRRLAHQLLDIETVAEDPFDAFRKMLLLEGQRTPPALADLKGYLNTCKI